MKSRGTLFKAILWLHLLRLFRYKYSFVNYIIINILWYMIFLLGALMFVPSNRFSEMAIITFWGIVLWTIMENSVWLIAGWTWFVLAIGIVEEHIIHGVNPLLFIAGRFLTGSSVSLATLPLVMIIFAGIVGEKIFSIYNIVYLLLGLALMLLYSVLYALILAALSFRTEIPGTMLDIINIFMYIGGGLGIPVSYMPDPVKPIILFIPYTHAAEITRYGILGLEPYIGLSNEVLASTMYLCVLAILCIAIVGYVTRHIRIHGVRAVGMM